MVREQYACVWSAYHDALPEANSNRISPKIRLIALKLKLFGRALDLRPRIIDLQHFPEQTVILTMATEYQREALSVVSETRKTPNDPWKAKGSTGESMKTLSSALQRK